MRVRTLKPHGNHLGDKYQKAVGDEYDAGDHAEVLIADGLAEAVQPDSGAATDEREQD
jgi:hypothetical protein